MQYDNPEATVKELQGNVYCQMEHKKQIKVNN